MKTIILIKNYFKRPKVSLAHWFKIWKIEKIKKKYLLSRELADCYDSEKWIFNDIKGVKEFLDKEFKKMITIIHEEYYKFLQKELNK